MWTIYLKWLRAKKIRFNAINVSKLITPVVNRDHDLTATREWLNHSRKHSCITCMTSLHIIRLRFWLSFMLKLICTSHYEGQNFSISWNHVISWEMSCCSLLCMHQEQSSVASSFLSAIRKLNILKEHQHIQIGLIMKSSKINVSRNALSYLVLQLKLAKLLDVSS